MNDSLKKGRTVNLVATDRQRLAWRAWENDMVDDVVFGGGAGSGKSFLGCQAITAAALKWPGTRYYIGRKELKTLMQTSYITLTQKVFPKFGLTQETDWKFDGKYNVVKFKNGSTINLLDLAYAPADPLYDRFGSHEYTRGWIEEASEVNFKAYDVLKSRVGRHLNSEFKIKSKTLLTLNPSQDWPYRLFYKPWKDAGKPTNPDQPLISVRSMMEGKEVDRTFVFIQSLYKDNPFTAAEYGRSLATISDPVLKQRLMEGDWEYASASDTLFHASSIADLFTNPVAQSNDLFLTVDAARLGGDEIVLTHWRGWDAYKIDRYTMLRLPETAEKIRTAIDSYGIPRHNVLVDEDGIGGGVLDLVPGIIGFTGNAAPFGVTGERDTKENYQNLKAQCVYHLSYMARDRKVRVSEMNLETREKIADDLKQFKRKDPEKAENKLKVVPKEEMKAALGRSPDCGDTLMMRSYFDLRTREEGLGSSFGEITTFVPDYY